MVKGMTSSSGATRRSATRSARTTRGPDFPSFQHLYEERREQLWQFLLMLAPRPGDVPALYARTWFEYAGKLCRHRRRPGDGFPAELYRIACDNVTGAWRATAPQRRAAGHLVVQGADGPDWLGKVQQAALATLIEHNGLEPWQASRVTGIDPDRAQAMLEAAERAGADGRSLAARVHEQSLQQAGSSPHRSLDGRVLGQVRERISAPPPAREGGRAIPGNVGRGLRRAAIVLVVAGVTGLALTWAAMTLAGRPEMIAVREAPGGAAGAGLSVAELFSAVEQADRAGDYNRVARLSAALDLRLGNP